LYIDGVPHPLTGDALPYVEGCGSPNIPFLFADARETVPGDFSPGPFIFDDFAIFDQPLTSEEISEIVARRQPLLIPAALDVIQAEMKFGPQAKKDDSFKVEGGLSLSNRSNGITPLGEDVSLQVGEFSITIPAGSFTQHGKGTFKFNGIIAKVALRVVIQVLDERRFDFEASAEGVNLTGTLVPLTMSLTIGDDRGSTSLMRGKAKFGKHITEPD
jgi:hypothetical protein